MKRPLIWLLISISLSSLISVTTSAASIIDRVRGRILLQVESYGEAWYVVPTEGNRIYMRNGDVAYSVMSHFGLGITDANLKKIPVGLENRFQLLDSDNDGLYDKLEESLGTDPHQADSDHDGHSDGVEVQNDYDPLSTKPTKLNFDYTMAGKLKGAILLQVESRGEAWYLDPVLNRRFYMPDGEAAYQIMRYLSLGITNANLSQIPISNFAPDLPPPLSVDTQSPSAPSNLTLSVSGTQISLTWTASTDNIGVIQYSVERSTSATTGFNQIATPSINSYTNTSLSASTTYYYRIRAQDAAGNLSAYSSIRHARTTQTIIDTQAPSIPNGFIATGGDGQIVLTWTASTDNIGVTQYSVERSTSATTGFNQIATPSINSYTNTGLGVSTRYYYRIRAMDAAGNFSSYSSIVNATTTSIAPPIDTQSPSAPSNLAANATSTQIALTWTASADNMAVVGYQIFRSTTNGSGYTQINTSSNTSYTNTGLDSNTTYYYVVRAYDAAGNVSNNSSQAQATTPATPPSVQYVSISQPYIDRVVVANANAPEGTAYTWRKNNSVVVSGNSPTTFLVHYDGNLLTSNGEAPVAQSNVSFANAQFGQGMKGKAEYPVANNLDFNEGTIELWLSLDQSLNSSVYGSAPTGDPYIFKYVNPSTGEKMMMNIKNIEGMLLFTVHSGNSDPSWSGAVQINTSYNDILANESMLLSMTYSKADNKASLYLNGFKISQDDYNFNFSPANSNLVIGNNNAIVDEFRILNKALTADEIMNNYLRGVPFGSNEIYYSGSKNVNDNLQLSINLQDIGYTANSLVRNGKITSISPTGHVLSNRNSIDLSFNTASAATCRYGKKADNFSDLPYTVSGTGTSHSIGYSANSITPSHDFYIKCQSSNDGDDYAYYRRFRILPNIDNRWPKIGLITWGNNITSNEVDIIAKYDIASLSNGNIARPSLLEKIKEANQNIILLPYIVSDSNTLNYGTASFVHQDLYEKLADTWRLRNASGQYINNLGYLNEMMYNLNTSLPWAETLAEHVEKEIISRGDWDGIWYDNTDTTFWWLYDYNASRFTQTPDFDLDGVNEDLNISTDFNKARNIWRDGLAQTMTLARQAMGSNAVIVGNNGDVNPQLYNGKTWERFLYYHTGGFNDNLEAFLNINNSNSFLYWNSNSAAPHLNWNLFELNNATDYKNHRLGLVASLLAGVYYNPVSMYNYREFRWYDEYWVDWSSGDVSNNASVGRGYLGSPVTTAGEILPNIWRRDFQHGIVILNNSTSTVSVDLGDEFRYINGGQDRVANPGGTTQTVLLSAYDARILLTTENNDPLR